MTVNPWDAAMATLSGVDTGLGFVTPDEALACIDRTDQYIRNIDNDFNRAQNVDKVLTPKAGAPDFRQGVYYRWTLFHAQWLEYLKKVDDYDWATGGTVGYLNAGSYMAECEQYRTRAIAYQAELKLAAPNETSVQPPPETPVAKTEDDPIKSLADGIANTGRTIVYTAAALAGGYVVLKYVLPELLKKKAAGRAAPKETRT